MTMMMMMIMIMMMTLGAMDCESNLYSRGKMKNMMRRLANYTDWLTGLIMRAIMYLNPDDFEDGC